MFSLKSGLWAPRLEEGNVYVFKRLLSSENEKKVNVIEAQFQMNVTKATKCVRLSKIPMKSNVMLPITNLGDLPIVRAQENCLRPAISKNPKKGDPSRFVEVYVVDESLSKIATVLTVWDNIYEQYTDLFGHGFTKPFVLTALGLKVKDFRGRFTLSASNFSVAQDITIMQPGSTIGHGTITDIDMHHQIHYEACDQCNKSPGERANASAPCVSCEKSPVNVVPRFLLTMTIGDSQDMMKVTAFNRDAQEILYMQVEKALEIRAQMRKGIFVHPCQTGDIQASLYIS